VVDVGRARSALDLFDQVRAMTWRLLHPRTWAPTPRTPPQRRCPCTWRCRWSLPLPLSLPLSLSL